MEDKVRKLCLTLAAGLAVLSTGAVPSHANGMLPGAQAIYRPALEAAPVLEQVGLICTHFWSGRWHYRQVCFPGHRHHHRHHHLY